MPEGTESTNKFPEEKTMDADDIVASINHHRGEESKSAAKPIVAPITDIKADGKNRVIVTLEGGNADFPLLMSDYHLAIMPAKDGKADWQSGVGTGGTGVARADAGAVGVDVAHHPSLQPAAFTGSLVSKQNP